MSSDRLRNVGPKSAAWLRQVGIRTPEELLAAGAVGAFMKVKRAGFRPSLNLLYSLEGAILGCHWQQVPEARRQQMAAEVEELSALLPDPKKKRPGGPVTYSEGPAMQREAGEEEQGPELSFGFDDPCAGSEGSSAD
ncbi:MAG: TfoX/Sxy family protein [Aquimonas sp.]|nr:TfoX/Sxy family protein [Aquimonas sp.]